MWISNWRFRAGLWPLSQRFQLLSFQRFQADFRLSGPRFQQLFTQYLRARRRLYFQRFRRISSQQLQADREPLSWAQSLSLWFHSCSSSCSYLGCFEAYRSSCRYLSSVAWRETEFFCWVTWCFLASHLPRDRLLCSEVQWRSWIFDCRGRSFSSQQEPFLRAATAWSWQTGHVSVRLLRRRHRPW